MLKVGSFKTCFGIRLRFSLLFAFRTASNLNPKKHTVRISCYFISAPTNYAWQLSDPNHLILTSVPPDPAKPDPKHKPAKPAAPFTPAVLTLTRTPTPDHYPLLERGFHFISEWRYER